ncbi:MAG: ATP-binding protein [Pseudobutyrivibrio sp.]|nr:ATP-binding protein [Pseudobutyrivibrio sp.]
MYDKISGLLMYGDLTESSILYQLGKAIDRLKDQTCNKTELIKDIHAISKRLLMLGTDYGFDKNLWHNYIAYYIITNENPFSLVTEKTDVKPGSVNYLVENDFKILKEIFDYDFSQVEKALGINCFSIFTNYQSVQKNKQMYNRNVSAKVQSLSEALEKARDEKEFFAAVTDFYKAYGVGMFGLNKAFRMAEDTSDGVKLIPISNMEEVRLDDLVGYDYQKKQLRDNTAAFVQGMPANNVLLFGDSGTGKSTSVKAIVNEYYDEGIRMIEIYKHQFRYLSTIISMIKNRNYKFIIYMDDLSFEEHEIEYKFLKAVIEGGVETRPDNILIYATSNRRHLIKETWNDRNDQDNLDDRHHSDTVEEKLSLVNRFGVTISFSKPLQKEYIHIVEELAKRQDLKMDEEELVAQAKIWEMEHGGLSGRTAKQFINHLLGGISN